MQQRIQIPFVTTTVLGTTETPMTAAPQISPYTTVIPKTQVLPFEIIPQDINRYTNIIILPPINQKQFSIRFQFGVTLLCISLLLSCIPIVTLLLFFAGQYILWVNYQKSKMDTHLCCKQIAKKSITVAWTFLVLWILSQLLLPLLLFFSITIAILASLAT